MTHFGVATTSRDLVVIVRILAGLRMTGRLDVSQDQRTGHVWFDQGQIVAAECGAEQGLPALDAIMLVLQDGHCSWSDEAHAAAPNVQLPAAAPDAHFYHLAQRQARLARTVPSLTAIPRIRPTPGEDYDELVTLPRSAVDTLLQLNEQR